ncbi:hypothetical protein B0H15DRAFT_778846 [Mycena belliarum]|uniref:Uncharacterized protein n=1 Tax=Mycena belliarum TaxID=1033014 RepID=A0AAD6UAM1_9AGAR|nr:hypothetical protein B0H15DRAFT_778846 [Mycena belliae]
MSPSDPPPPMTPPVPPAAELDDPPPPYPSRGRRSRRPSRRQIQTGHHGQFSSTDSHSDYEALASSQPDSELEADQDATEATPFLPPRRIVTRPRSGSHPSVMSSTSVAPSLAQTLASIFQEDDEDEELGTEDSPVDGLLFSAGEIPENHSRPKGFWSRQAWRRYFRPMTQKVYFKALFHLYVVNFPFALAAFLFAVVFTVTGTTLLVAVPLGALLCFFNLLGVRTFSRGELALQTKYHGPLAYAAPYPPRPIFTRMRESNALGPPIPETSFYKNTYAMFRDPTSYQALFYFLVIKPSITLLLSLGLLVLGVPALVLIAPAPIAFRAIRKLGIWQANVAVEGLYLAVR